MDSAPDRSVLIAAFLDMSGWGGAPIDWLDQDASTRRYGRLIRGDDRAILMDAPLIESEICRPGMTAEERAVLGWNAQTRLAGSRVDAFVLIADHLRRSGLRPPAIYAHDSGAGLALIEDFGEGREFARLIEKGEADEGALYRKAAKTLAHLHNQATPQLLRLGAEAWPILEFDQVALQSNADLFADWMHQYDPRARMRDEHRSRWEDVRDGLIAQAMEFPRAFTLRDYHAENLIYLPDDEIGLLDFQDAVLGWDAWDIAMLTQDARRVVSPKAAQAAITTYLDATGKHEDAFQERLAIIGALNALRIAGVFARLVKRDGKERYNAFMPRQQAILARNLMHPATAEMAAFIRETAPFILESGHD